MDDSFSRSNRERTMGADAIHPAPDNFSPAALEADPILHFFHYAHLPAALRTTSRPFCELAALVVGSLPRNAERSVALRKLREAKDAAVRANAGPSTVASGGSFIDRLKTEHRELKDRLAKLQDFLDGETIAGIPEIQQDMLRQQRGAMTEYLAILSARIENIEHEASLGEVKEIGGADQDRDGDPPFQG